MPKEQQGTVELIYRGPDDTYHTFGREHSFQRDGDPVAVSAELAAHLMSLRYNSPLHRFEERAPEPERAALPPSPAIVNDPVVGDLGEATSELHSVASLEQAQAAQAEVATAEAARKAARGK